MPYEVYLKSVFNFDLVSSIKIILHSLFCYTCDVLTLSVLRREKYCSKLEEIGKREHDGEARALEEMTLSCFLFVIKIRKYEV